MPRKSLPVAVVFASFALVAPTAHALAGDGNDDSARPACVVDEAAATRSGPVQADGISAGEEWYARPGAQRVVDAVGAKVRSRFGVDRFEKLKNGYIGTVRDNRTQEFVIIVDPKRAHPATVEAEVAQAALAERARAPQSLPAVRVRARAGCFAATELIEAQQVIEAREWHPRAKNVFFGGSLNAYDSAFHLWILT